MNIFESLFLISVILIWFMVGYQFILTLFGYINFIGSIKEKRKLEGKDVVYPTCSILIPAHNEEKVIRKTIESMLKLKYPDDKLKIIVINDGSTDSTREIIEEFTKINKKVLLYDIPVNEGGKGKSRTLNLGIRQSDSEIVAIYDADNTPEENALIYLVSQLISDPALGAVIGKFKTRNKKQNLLTRFINIETLSFQSILQAGRWQLHNIATLPGTNLVIRRSLITLLDGWDEEALTEDSELSIRIFKSGYKIKYIPYAITYEQEPQTWSAWSKQRIRWVRGNNYVLNKFIRHITDFKNRKLRIELFYTLSLYYIFFIAILVSDLLFILSVVNLISIPLPGPYTLVWIIAFLVYVFEIMLAISYDREDSVSNLGIIILMYFTYCQFWIYIILKAFYLENIRKAKHHWIKTERF